MWECFCRRVRLWKEDGPPSWRIMEFLGIPKFQSASCFEDFRWIGKLAVMSKGYLRSLRTSYNSGPRPSLVHTHGFKPGHSTDEIVALIRQLLYLGHVWRDIELFIAIEDTAVAFDSMDHDIVTTCLLKRGVHPADIRALLRELSGLQGRIVVPGAGVPMNLVSREVASRAVLKRLIYSTTWWKRCSSHWFYHGSGAASDSSWEMFFTRTVGGRIICGYVPRPQRTLF